MGPLVPALLLLAAAVVGQSGGGGYPTEKQLTSEAKAYVDALCKETASSCGEAKQSIATYTELLEKITRCDRKDCGEEELGAFRFDIYAADKETAKLPLVSSKPINSLLRLSALCSKRLVSAATRIKKPEAGADFYSDDVGPPKVVEKLCLENHSTCQEARALYTDLRKLKTGVAACDRASCPFSKVDNLSMLAQDDLNRSLSLHTANADTLPIYSHASALAQRTVKILIAFVDDSLSSYKRDNDAFDARLSKAANDQSVEVESMPGEGNALLRRYQETLLAVDALSNSLGYDKNEAAVRREAVNAQTTRLTAMRGRALLILTARGLQYDPASESLVSVTAGSGGGAKAKLPTAGTTRNWKPALLDKRSVPPVSSAPAPAIVAGNFSEADLKKKEAGGTDLEKADAKRRMGKTTTVGQPGLYAPLVYHQASGTTCGIATQVQVLKAHGILPAGDSSAQEGALASEAEASGYYRKGTSPERTGSMLEKRGLIVTKHVGASWADFEAAVRRGRTLLTGVDARRLWESLKNDPDRASHDVLVTGGEIDKKTSELLGVYINDSGAWPATGGRFLPTTTMKSAFTGDFAEVQ